MNAVHRQSGKTLVWLPLDEKSAIAAKSLILDVWHYVMANERMSTEQAGERTDSLKTSDHPKPTSQLPNDKDDRWLALSRLLYLPWFKRCWVIEEICLSSTSPTILCGTQVLQWSHFEQATRWIYRHPQEIGLLGRAHCVARIGIIGEREEWADGTNDITWDLQALLHLTHWFRATDPRDRIFALLGLCRQTRDPAHWPSALNPDYSKPLPDLFAQVTRYCMCESKNLNILHIIDAAVIEHHQGAEFPSWIPRWDAPSELWTSTGQHTVWHYPTWKGLNDQYNHASKGRIPIIDEDTAPSTLRICGIRISPEKHVCSPVFYDDVFPASTNAVRIRPHLQHEIFDRLETCKLHLPATSTADVHRAFFMVTCMGQTTEATDATCEPLLHFESYLGLHASHLSGDDAQDDDVSQYTLNTTNPSHKNSSLAAMPSRYAIRLEVMINRRLFITASGHLGFGPASMLLSDVVVVLFGGNVPLVLRLVEDARWRFVGECYVHGIMKGEALLGEGECEDEWFDIV